MSLGELPLRDLMNSPAFRALPSLAGTDDWYVYFIRPLEAPGPVKIGTTRNVAKRLDGYITHSPLVLSLVALGVGHGGVERDMHRLFHRDRLHGEWFTPSPELDAVLAAFALTDGAEIPRFVHGAQESAALDRRVMATMWPPKGLVKVWMEHSETARP